MYRKVLIATDGSTTASKAVVVAGDMVKATGATALLLHVGEPAKGGDVLDQAAKLLPDGVTVEKKSVEGDAAERIIDVAESDGVDLIIIGNKGMTGAKRFLLGSVPNHVSHHAPCNVLIVKTT